VHIIKCFIVIVIILANFTKSLKLFIFEEF
jgi:hypothetical protein